MSALLDSNWTGCLRECLPARIRALFVTVPTASGDWLRQALSADSATQFDLEQITGAAPAVARLRDESFDLVLLLHAPPQCDALETVEGLRTGGHEEPILILTDAADAQFTPLAYEAGADAHLCIPDTTTRTLLWTAARAIERRRLQRDNRRLLMADRQRLRQEHLEADRLLSEQRALIRGLEALSAPPPSVSAADPPLHPRTSESCTALDLLPLPDNLIALYRELLRAYVIMGHGNLSAEMQQLSDLLAATGISPRQTMLLHLQVLEELLRGLGSRGARHVMTRGDLLVLEMMMHLAEGYRTRYLEQNIPVQQKWLPGFVEQAA